MKRFANPRSWLISAVILAGSLFWAHAADQQGSEAFYLVIVFPGGPEVDETTQQMITEFASTLATQAQFDPSHVVSRMFTRTDDAVAFVADHQDAFIMGSLGFFLAHRKQFNLIPLANVGLPEGANETFTVLVKKGRYPDLAALKGKTFSGSALYESPQFLSRIVFDGTLDVAEYFVLEPTSRPLSAVRKLLRDRIDAVILNQIQYHALQSLDLFQQVETVYQSPQLPPLGLMMVKTQRTTEIQARVVDGILGLMASEEGRETCQAFGVYGFQKIAPDGLDEIITSYDRN